VRLVGKTGSASEFGLWFSIPLREKCFFINGRINKRNCIIKIDTDSDVTLVRERLLEFSRQQIFRDRSFNLKYPTGERVPVKFKVEVLIEVGELSMKLPVYIVEMKDDCLLGNDFLSAMNFEETLVSFFGVSSQGKEEFVCSRIENEVSGVPLFLREHFMKETQNLNEKQKEQFANFLIEFQDVFSEEIIAENGRMVEHRIEIESSGPIKQAPRCTFSFAEES